MKLLLDSHSLIWWASADPTLSDATVELISSPHNEVFVSVVSVWELGLKLARGKLRAPDNYLQLCKDNCFAILPVNLAHAEATLTLPPVHFDPFDRMLVAQCQVEKAILITRDKVMASYDIQIIPA
jgi:PIN domain nuclease of toxin-antitoxin system